jgi:hypothetical protein
MTRLEHLKPGPERGSPSPNPNGRPPIISRDVRAMVYMLMRDQRHIQRKIDALLDREPIAHTTRNHADVMRRIWRRRGK